MNTRQADLDLLEARAAKDPRAQKTLEKVFKQSKNPKLEEARRKMMEAQKRNDHKRSDQIESHILQFDNDGR